MLISASVITYIVIVCPIMSSTIRAVVIRLPEIEIIVIGKCYIYPEIPGVARSIDRTIEIIHSQETVVLTGRKYPAEIVISYIQVTIIVVQCPIITIHDIIHQITHVINKIKIYLVSIVILCI